MVYSADPWIQAAIICAIMLAVVAVLANVAVCWLVWARQKLKNYVNGFVVSLAASDIIMCTTFFIYFALPSSHPKSLVTVFCLGVAILSEIGNFVAVLYERYLAIVKPFQYKNRMHLYFKRAIPALWTTAIVVSILNVVFFNVANISSLARTIIYFSSLLVLFVIPMVMIFVMYGYIYAIIRRQKRIIGHFIGGIPVHVTERERLRRKTEIKIVKMFFIVVFMFSVRWIPLLLYVSGLSRGFCASSTFYILSLNVLATLLCSLLNPFIFTFVKQDFQLEIKALVSQVHPRQKEPGAVIEMRTTQSDLPLTSIAAARPCSFSAEAMTKATTCEEISVNDVEA